VTQCDILAEFQMKNFASQLKGYYTINGPTHGTKLQLYYVFSNSTKQNPKYQTVKLEGIYSERSLAYRHDLYADLAMEFSAYPKHNFYMVVRNVVSIRFYVFSCNSTCLFPSWMS
jgi:hypothetical protein